MKADEEKAAEQKSGVDALAALSSPVHIFKVEPEREFVERESRSNAIQHGHERRSPARGVPDAEPGLREPSVADTEQEQDTPDQMMDVDVADDDVSKRAGVAMDRVSNAAEDAEG